MSKRSSNGFLDDQTLCEIWDEDICKSVFRHAVADAHPVSIWLGGQPGSGKTSGMRSVCRLYPEKSVVLIEGDDYRQYHPVYLSVMESNPLDMPSVTQQAEGRWIAMAVQHALDNGYSSLIEGTWRNTEVVLRESRRAKQLGRLTHACIVAVPPVESGVGILRRYIDALIVGHQSRWTSPHAHDAVVNSLPHNVETIAQDGSIDRFTVLARDGAVLYDSSDPSDRFEAIACWKRVFDRSFTRVEVRSLVAELKRLRRLYRRYDANNVEAFAFIDLLAERL